MATQPKKGSSPLEPTVAHIPTKHPFLPSATAHPRKSFLSIRIDEAPF